MSVCTQLKFGHPTRRFRISCKGKSAEIKGLSVVCKTTHGKAKVAMKREAGEARNEGRGRNWGFYILIAKKEAKSGGLSVVCKTTHGGREYREETRRCSREGWGIGRAMAEEQGMADREQNRGCEL